MRVRAISSNVTWYNCRGEQCSPANNKTTTPFVKMDMKKQAHIVRPYILVNVL